MSLSRFHPLIVEWFRSSVGTPTDVQVQAWPAIQSGVDVLIAAPTGGAAITLPERPVCVRGAGVHELTRSANRFLLNKI